MKKRLSIIIPHYNSIILLKKLLSTIPNISEIQTIVVDDYSTDDLEELELCKTEYKDTNIEFYVNEFKKSAGGARNTGLKYAKGQWLLFADADDYFISDFYNIVREYFDSENDLVYFRSTSIDLTTNEKSDRHKFVNDLIDDYLGNPNRKSYVRLKYNYVSPCAKLVRRKLLDEYNIRFDEVEVANDVMCSIKLAVHTERICVSEDVIYCITKQSGTLTTLVTEERYDARMEVYYRRHRYLKENLPKKDYNLLRFDARVRLKQIKQNNLGTKKYFKVLFDIFKQGVPIWREFSPSYYCDVVCYLLGKSKHS